MSPNDVRARFEALDHEQREALRQRLRARDDGQTLSRRPADGGPIPLAFAQERLWFLDQLYPALPVYHLITWFRIPGRIDDTILGRAVDTLVGRHEVLRTVFGVGNGRPIQVIADSMPIPVERLSSRPVAGENALAAAQNAITCRAFEPFDLAKGPLIRVLVAEAGYGETVVAIAMHHIVSDGWSLGIVQRELTALYGAIGQGRPSPLPDLPLQFADYSAWQRRSLQGPNLDRLLGYWRKQLADAPRILELPYDKPRPPASSSLGAVRSVAVPWHVADGLRRIAQQEGATLFMTLLAAWSVLLFRYSGQSDLVIGSPVANRNHLDLEGLIGCFANLLALRIDVGGNPTFRELLGRVREVVIGGFAHQDMPFERLVEDLQPERSLGHQPIAQVMFSLETVPGPAQVASAPTTEGSGPPDGVESDTVETILVEGTSKFDLTLYMADDPQGMRAGLEYTTDLFEHETIQRMAQHVVTLLGGIAASPDCRISELPLLPPSERRRLLVDWNGVPCPPPADCFHHLVEANADSTPQALAIVFAGQTVTYGDLDRRANRLANHLISLGVEPDTIVGLCLDRSPDMIVAMLGIWKAGAAYLPLDPAYPSERLRFMCSDAELGFVVTTCGLGGTLPIDSGREVLLDGPDGEAIAAQPDTRPRPGIGPGNLAYVIYTSGSTGQPKGVLLQHGGLCNTAAAMGQHFDNHPGTRTLAFSSLSFDASLFEIAMTLSGGGAVYVAPRETLLPGPDLTELMREARITNAVFPPSVLSLLPNANVGDLREIIVGAEACPVDLLDRWVPGRRFFNGYGPTEATIFCTITRVTDTSRRPTIGKPIDNMRLYVLDRDLNPTPIGVPGDLYIAGPGLARGYLGRPGLTAERFLPDPFAETPGQRMYHTGDVARWLPDGNLDFKGRIDRQVKIRGFRIELDEVEAVLCQYPGVKAAAVVASSDTRAGGRLLAYYVADPRQPATVDDLRTALRRTLPDYMVPNQIVQLDRMPLSPNGKVDRAALMSQDRAADGPAGAHTAPRTALETVIAGIWAEVLGRDRVGVFDNFFDLGGHSLLGTLVVSRLQERHGIAIPINALFEEPTVAGMAATIGSQTACGSPDPGQVRPGTDVARRPPSITRQRDVSEDEAANVAALSDDEVDVMLEALFSEQEDAR